jgi:hypothetical protein
MSVSRITKRRQKTNTSTVVTKMVPGRVGNYSEEPLQRLVSPFGQALSRQDRARSATVATFRRNIVIAGERLRH